MKLPGVTDEERALKEWLTDILPAGLSRQDMADELRVTRKTFANMISPKQESFGHGIMMLRYLQLAGAVVDAPTESPASSRLAALEKQVAESVSLTREAIRLLREARQPNAEAPPTPAPAKKTRKTA